MNVCRRGCDLVVRLHVAPRASPDRVSLRCGVVHLALSNIMAAASRSCSASERRYGHYSSAIRMRPSTTTEMPIRTRAQAQR